VKHIGVMVRKCAKLADELGEITTRHVMDRLEVPRENARTYLKRAVAYRLLVVKVCHTPSKLNPHQYRATPEWRDALARVERKRLVNSVFALGELI
jgi:hypothetical protein